MSRPTDIDDVGNPRAAYSPHMGATRELIARFGREIMAITHDDNQTRKIVKRVVFETKLMQALLAAERETYIADCNARDLVDIDRMNGFDKIHGTRAADGDIE